METKIKKLTLKKEAIVDFDEKNQIAGGGGGANEFENRIATFGACTGGCSDGCTGSEFLCSTWNCTKTSCTDDCGTGVCDTGWTCTF